MGIKHFWIWFRQNFANQILSFNRHNPSVTQKIDVLAIDMNGIFHTCAQKIYRYGNYAPYRKKLLHNNSKAKERRLFMEIANEINFLKRLVNPTKKLLLCVDGVAGMGKMYQQRQRRFRSAKERHGDGFDSNCISPGTQFMDSLSGFLDWYFQAQISSNPEWSNIEVLFSNEKVPGEGEHKIINYLRRFKSSGESCCIHGMDADLIMLGLAAPCEKIFILREDSFRKDLIHFVNLGEVRQELKKRLVEENPNDKNISDFLLMCYFVGNDFLPQIPGVEILEGGIDALIADYHEIFEDHGPLATKWRGKLKLKKKSLQEFLKSLADQEEDFISEKFRQRGHFFHDEIMEKASKPDSTGESKIDIETYKKLYYKKKFPTGTDKEQICYDYVTGMQWVLNYYTSGIPSWSWQYPWQYAPFISDLAQFIEKFKPKPFPRDHPLLPFQQLMMILLEKSSNLLPSNLSKFMTSESSLAEFFPEKFEIDLSGKRKEWEGIILLPRLDLETLNKIYDQEKINIGSRGKRRNIRGKIFKYVKCDTSRATRSYFGNIAYNYCFRTFSEF